MCCRSESGFASRHKSSVSKMLKKPYLIFLGDVQDVIYAKTGLGLRDWCGEDVVGEYALPVCNQTLGLAKFDPATAAQVGAKSLVIGVAPVGGKLPESYWPTLFAAVDAGLDIVSGLHDRLSNIPGLSERAAAAGVALHDIRHPGTKFPAGTGRKRTGMRVLMVGTDCALGKKYTALAVTNALKDAGANATFRATGQTGIMISGAGIPIDAVVSDFIAGAAEVLSPDNDPDHWDVIEGQGALFHPAYAGVTLGLLHGSQPDALILCHDPRRTEIEGFPGFPIPKLTEAIRRYEEAAWLTNPKAKCIAISLNTSSYSESERQKIMANIVESTGLPVFDPVRDGAGIVAMALMTRATSK
jgi:uncharacterized NAD-dependent epimerase/dehydratase family protein